MTRPAILAVLILLAALGQALAQGDMCSSSRPSSLGMFFAFVVNCECSVADRSTTNEFFQSYASNLCDAEFAEEMDVYYGYALERGWMLDGRCFEVCETDAGIMMSVVLNIISGLEGALIEMPPTATWDVESGDFADLGCEVREEIERAIAADRQEGIADADTYEAPERSTHEIYELRLGDDQYANPFCRTQTSSPKCRRTDAD